MWLERPRSFEPRSPRPVHAHNPGKGTLLDERIATAREISAILSKPQPAIEPLPLIAAKLANPQPKKVVGLDEKKSLRLPKEARDAFAMEPSRSSGSFDRAGTGGW